MSASKPIHCEWMKDEPCSRQVDRSGYSIVRDADHTIARQVDRVVARSDAGERVCGIHHAVIARAP